MGFEEWMQIITAAGAVATPVLILVLTGIGRGISTRFERRVARESQLLQRRLELEDMLREDRIGVYNEILEPFIILLTSDAAWNADAKNKNRDKSATASQTMLSLEYRKQSFKLALVGSDAVVRSYTNLMQHFFQTDNSGSDGRSVPKTLELLAEFLLEIRRSMGNEATALSGWEMLEWLLKDARLLRESVEREQP